LRCNGELVALFDTVEAGKADAEVRAAQLIAAAAEEDAWYASWPETAPSPTTITEDLKSETRR
jgi:hypothetical protein